MAKMTDDEAAELAVQLATRFVIAFEKIADAVAAIQYEMAVPRLKAEREAREAEMNRRARGW